MSRGERLKWRRKSVVAAAVAVLVVGYVVWDLRTESMTGPDPTVADGDSCGGGAPAAVLAIDAASGKQRWSARVGQSWSLDLTDGTVAASGGGSLRALDVADGRARWCRAFEPRGEVLGAVAADGAFVGSKGNSVVAYRARDGRQLWTRQGTGDWLTSDGEVAVLRRGFASPKGQTTRGLTGSTGEERWVYRTPPASLGLLPAPRFFASPDLGLTYVHDGLGLVAAGPADAGGDGVRWSLPVFRPIGLDGDVLVGGVAESFTEPLTRFGLQAVDRATGTVLWHKSVPGFDARLVGGLVIVLHPTDPRDAPGPDGSRHGSDGPVAPASPESAVIATAYDPVDGRVRWKRRLPFAAQIHAAGKVAIVWVPAGVDTENDGRLIALDPASGDVTWRAELANPARSERFHLGDDVRDVVYDDVRKTLLVLVEAQEPYRD